jgi:hypothetical protein
MVNAGMTKSPRSRQQPKVHVDSSVAVSITRLPTNGPHPLLIGVPGNDSAAMGRIPSRMTDADPDIPIPKEAKAEYAKLQ